MSQTICIQIGNTDNKLTQQEWAKFVNEIHDSVVRWGNEIHFSAPSVGWADWQNAAWIFTCDTSNIRYLRADVTDVRKKYRQDSVAWLQVSIPEFI
jgi:hypothetical protein